MNKKKQIIFDLFFLMYNNTEWEVKMNQEKFGKLIKELRKKHHLTQKQLAEKYHVTYQAVSKWETGKNMPDTSLIKQISEDFHITLEDLYNGEISRSKKRKHLLIISMVFILVSILLLIILLHHQKDMNFQFKTLTANCENFNISGNISYNHSKTAIYITNIQYCGEENQEEYETIECILYETNQTTDRKINSYQYTGTSPIKLEDFLKEVTISIDNYEKSCKEFQNETLFLAIHATKKDQKKITYKIPLNLESCPIETNATKS